ncbi:copper chaperone PCu(A)C [Stenotrophomonas ginsengisoli]|uniref:copper chaperone PCu(A)C n=1 Tax=Stenotrophomonas ginsengisoli TaxID=336566 RepID=UPI0009F99DFC|nr:copper chaperone PCu(A)C [Stenotrophomonas ginsengisoli]
MIVKVLLVATTLLLLGGPARTERLPAPCLMLEQGWVRAPVAGRDMTAAYGQLHNNCRVAVELRLDRLSSLQADKVALHRTDVVDGVSRMRQVTELQLAPDEQVTLSPGGFHLMLHGLKPALTVGSEVAIQLEDSLGRVYVAYLPVRAR